METTNSSKPSRWGKRGVAQFAINLIFLIIGAVIALTAFSILLPTFVTSADAVNDTAVSGSTLFGSLLPFIIVMFVFLAIVVLLIKMVKGAKGGRGGY